MNLLRAGLGFLLASTLAACMLRPGWHWEKPGYTEADYAVDETFCKQQVYSGTDGMVNSDQVRRMHTCLAARGWRKVGD